jgi:hypothetical protein
VPPRERAAPCVHQDTSGVRTQERVRGGRRRGVVEVSCRRMSLFLKDTHESHDSIRKPLVRTGNRAHVVSTALLRAAPRNAEQTVQRLSDERLCSCIRQVHCTTSHTSDRPRRSRHRPPPATGRNCCSSLSTLCVYVLLTYMTLNMSHAAPVPVDKIYSEPATGLLG